MVSYGYTGEWYGGYTELLHLRARWYSPGEGVFLSRDPVESEPPYQYVRGNPVNWTDASGYFPDYCRKANSKEAYAYCLMRHYHITPAQGNAGEKYDLSEVQGTPGCWYGPVPYLATGYAEGTNIFRTIFAGGEEVVYDFATMQKQKFTYEGAGFTEKSLLALGGTEYFQNIYGFRSNATIDEYEGWSNSIYTGGEVPKAKFLAVGVLATASDNFNIRGSGLFGALGVAKKPFTKYRDIGTKREISFGPIVLGGGRVYYTKASQQITDYAKNKDGTDKLVDKERLMKDIFYNVNSPVPIQSFTLPGKIIALNDAFASALIHDEMYIGSQKE